MREILFRGKCIDDTCLNGKWLEGDILHDGVTGKYYINTDVCLNKSDNVGEEGILRFVAHEVDPETVCQYTGLIDKNGSKIFEGDIVKITDDEDGNYAIEWDDDTAKFTILLTCSVIYDFDNYWGYEVEVIGNSFDNPELLREEHWE